ncbi:MAG TPA: hypothetical protein VM143_04625 [Acidimicrobiales bacterium]|nr:hypothetical protein [Acidimicrobiales bacterium]
MSHRRIARLAATSLLLGAVGLASSLPATGQEATTDGTFDVSQEPVLLQYGWWNKAQQSPAGGAPAPPPPGAPSDGIYIAYEAPVAPTPAPIVGVIGIVSSPPAPAPTPVGPEAFGAVRYSVPAGSEGTLTLKFVPTSSSQPGGVNVDAGDLYACPVSSAWDPVQNARYDSAPKYDCTIGVLATYAGDTVAFALPASMTSTGVVDVALVPQGTKPFKLSVSPPSDTSLALTSVPESEATTAEFDPGSFEDPALTFDESVDGAVGADELGSASFDDFTSGDFSADGFATTTGAGTRGAVDSLGRAVAAPAAVVGNPFRPDASRGERLMAVLLLLALAVALWWVGGKPVRAPRLLGSLGVGAPVDAAEVKTGGIGRFARIRPATRPPRLF